jgi:hypothetical protein
MALNFCLVRLELPLSFCFLAGWPHLGQWALLPHHSQVDDTSCLNIYMRMSTYLLHVWKWFSLRENVIFLILWMILKDHITRLPLKTNWLGKQSTPLMATFPPERYSLPVTPRPSSQHSSQVVRWVENLYSNIKIVGRSWKMKLDIGGSRSFWK